jgi:hypothetical protein
VPGVYNIGMKNIKIIFWVLVAVIVVFGAAIYLFHFKNSPTADDSPVIYKNAEYGFTFSLPADWKGYSIVKSSWKGYPLASTTPQAGVTLLIRNPNWTSSVHYEDIPIMIFTISEWNSYAAGDFSTSAAPFPASELGRNNRYVFALPPRWDYDFSQGYQEAENILNAKSLHPFNL